MTMTAKTSKRIHFEPEEEEDEVESGVEDAALVESESAEALLVELLFAVEEAAALPSVLPFTLTLILTKGLCPSTYRSCRHYRQNWDPSRQRTSQSPS